MAGSGDRCHPIHAGLQDRLGGVQTTHFQAPPTPLDSDSGGGTRSHSTAHSSQICCLRPPGRAQPWKVTARLGALSLSAPVLCLLPAQLVGGPETQPASAWDLCQKGSCVLCEQWCAKSPGGDHLVITIFYE